MTCCCVYLEFPVGNTNDTRCFSCADAETAIPRHAVAIQAALRGFISSPFLTVELRDEIVRGLRIAACYGLYVATHHRMLKAASPVRPIFSYLFDLPPWPPRMCPSR